MIRNLFALENGGGFHHICIGRVGAAANADLIHLHPCEIFHRLDVIRAMRAGCQRRKRAEIDDQMLIVDRIRIRRKRRIILLSALGF